MGVDPWNLNEGKHDHPTSGIPARGGMVVAPQRKPAALVEQRLADAVCQGVVPYGIETIRDRIDAAIACLEREGHGRASSIYLTDSDMLALRAAEGRPVSEWRDIPVRIGSESKVYSKRGVGRAVRRPKKGKAA